MTSTSFAAVLQNYRLAGKSSWLYGVLKSPRWAQAQVGRSDIPDELLVLEDRVTWNTFQEVTKELKCSIRKVEKAHIIRLNTYCGLQEQGEFMTSLCREMGWVKMKPEEEEVRAEKVQCAECGKDFNTNAALATHEQKVHHRRIALRGWSRMEFAGLVTNSFIHVPGCSHIYTAAKEDAGCTFYAFLHQ